MLPVLSENKAIQSTALLPLYIIGGLFNFSSIWRLTFANSTSPFIDLSLAGQHDDKTCIVTYMNRTMPIVRQAPDAV